MTYYNRSLVPYIMKIKMTQFLSLSSFSFRMLSISYLFVVLISSQKKMVVESQHNKPLQSTCQSKVFADNITSKMMCVEGYEHTPRPIMRHDASMLFTVGYGWNMTITDYGNSNSSSAPNYENVASSEATSSKNIAIYKKKLVGSLSSSSSSLSLVKEKHNIESSSSLFDNRYNIDITMYDGECHIKVDGESCRSCSICVIGGFSYDCTNIINGTCTTNNECQAPLLTNYSLNARNHGFNTANDASVIDYLFPLDLGETTATATSFDDCDVSLFPVLSDTWTNPNDPNTSMGDQSNLRFSNLINRHALLKFAVTGITNSDSTENNDFIPIFIPSISRVISNGVSNASLRLKTTDHSTIDSLSVYYVDDIIEFSDEVGLSSSNNSGDGSSSSSSSSIRGASGTGTWDEDTLTANDEILRYDQLSPPLDVKTNLQPQTWYSFNVTSAIQKHGNGMYTFLIKSEIGGKIYDIYSKESGYGAKLYVK